MTATRSRCRRAATAPITPTGRARFRPSPSQLPGAAPGATVNPTGAVDATVHGHVAAGSAADACAPIDGRRRAPPIESATATTLTFQRPPRTTMHYTTGSWRAPASQPPSPRAPSPWRPVSRPSSSSRSRSRSLLRGPGPTAACRRSTRSRSTRSVRRSKSAWRATSRRSSSSRPIPSRPTSRTRSRRSSAPGARSRRAATIYNVYSSTMSDDAVQAVEREMSPKLAAFQDQITQNEPLFKRIAAVYDAREKSGLTPEQQRLTWYYYTNFVRAGAKLDPAAKKRMGGDQPGTRLAVHQVRPERPRRRGQRHGCHRQGVRPRRAAAVGTGRRGGGGGGPRQEGPVGGAATRARASSRS